MKKLINYLLKTFWFDPDNGIDTPWTNQTKVSGSVKEEHDPRLRHTADTMQPNLHTDTEEGFEAELVLWTSGEGKRDPALTEKDFELIRARNLRTDRYRELKRYWAAKKTLSDVRKVYKGKYGYGERTLEKYFSAFNSSLALKAY